MSSQHGVSAAQLLTLLTVLAIAAAVASPWLLRSKRTDAENDAIRHLRGLHASQTDHYGATMLFAPIEKLRKDNWLDTKANPSPTDYEVFVAPSGDMKRWCASANPVKDKPGKTFAIDETGIVLEYERSISPCIAGELVKTGGTPVR